MYFIWSILNRMIQGCEGKDRGEQKEIRKGNFLIYLE